MIVHVTRVTNACGLVDAIPRRRDERHAALTHVTDVVS